jgi:hypothetical protein
MDADDWLKSIEKKLEVVQCNNHEKVLLVSHQLFGPVAVTPGFKAKPDAHRMYAQDQVVIHTVRM